ncbi:MAG: pro-sigmaK processing inhibitor BofA family protein [Candidatus Altiarchaeia archaeon]
MKKAPVIAFLMVLLSGYAAAEDKLKPFIDYGAKMVQELSNPLIRAFFSLFPSFEGSLASFMGSLDETLPFLKGFHWLIYIALFFVLMAILAKMWEMSKHYIYNSIAGVVLLLVCIHLLGVELKITLMTLLITAVFGVPGVLFVLIAHYTGIVI